MPPLQETNDRYWASLMHFASILTVMAAVRTRSGVAWRYPLTVRLIR